MQLTEPISACEMCGHPAKFRFTNGVWAIVVCENCWEQMVELVKEAKK